LQKLLPHLGNANVNEAAVALQKINNLLATVGLDWNDFVTLLHDTEPSLLSLLSKLFAKDEDVLVELGLAGAEFFHSDSTAFADVNIDGHRKTWLLSGTEFHDWLLQQFFNELEKAPSLTAMKTAIGLFLRMRDSRVRSTTSFCVRPSVKEKSISTLAIRNGVWSRSTRPAGE
jgi:hypothetical protein